MKAVIAHANSSAFNPTIEPTAEDNDRDGNTLDEETRTAYLTQHEKKLILKMSEQSGHE